MKETEEMERKMAARASEAPVQKEKKMTWLLKMTITEQEGNYIIEIVGNKNTSPLFLICHVYVYKRVVKRKW